jgi:hypothetical protein
MDHSRFYVNSKTVILVMKGFGDPLRDREQWSESSSQSDSNSFITSGLSFGPAATDE